jgi:hypothetical protein
MLEIHLRHLQYVAAVCKEHIPALTVFRHILVLAFLERFQFGRVITFNPAGLVKTQRLPTAFGTVLIFQTVLDYLELQLPYRTDNLASVKLVDKQLRYTSSINWSIPLASCFCFIGSAFSIYLNISGEKLGSPRK